MSDRAISLSRADKKILYVLLLSSGELEPFTVYRRSKLGSSHFFERYFSLVKHNLICEVDGAVSLSDAGKSLIQSALPAFLAGDKVWRKVPERFLGTKLSGDDMYIPNLEMLSYSAFQEKMRDV